MTKPKPKCLEGYAPFAGFRNEHIPCPFQLLVAAGFPRAALVVTYPPLLFCVSNLTLLSLIKILQWHLRPIEIIQVNLSISRSSIQSHHQPPPPLFFLLRNLQGDFRTTISRRYFQFTRVPSQNSAYQFLLPRKLYISFKLLQDYLYFYYITEYNINYIL